MKFDGVRVSASLFDGILRTSTDHSWSRVQQLRQLWAWRLRRGREHLSEPERDIHVMTSYEEEMHGGASRDWSSDELSGYTNFFLSNALEVDRLVRMLAVIDRAWLVDGLREAQAMLPLPSPVPATPMACRLAIEAADARLTHKQRRRLSKLDNEAYEALEADPLALALLAYAAQHEADILVPERAPPPPEAPPAAVVAAPVVRKVDPHTTWERVANEQPENPPKYTPQTPFEPGSWLAHPKLGIGYVVEAREGKLRVLFATGERKLAVLPS